MLQPTAKKTKSVNVNGMVTAASCVGRWQEVNSLMQQFLAAHAQ